MEVTKPAERSSMPGPQEWFTGHVWMEDLGILPTTQRTRILRVTFEPSARTAWHTHPVGQILHVLDGTAWVQSEGGPIRELQPGDSASITAGERHWHGASPKGPMSHLAVQATDPDVGEETLWAEKVTDDEYSASAGS